MQKHPFSEYARKIKESGLLVAEHYPQDLEKEIIHKVSYNSNDVAANTLFVCKGLGFKEEYLDQAINKGAIAYISEKDYHKDIPCIIVNNIQETLSLVANIYYDYPWKKLKVIGVTGTKGKTTTAVYIKYILDEYLRSIGKPAAGLITTDSIIDGKRKTASHLTTPESLDLQLSFHNAVESGLQYMVVEVSSQALKYGRVSGVNFAVGVFLNISPDHISPVEHQDYADYFSSKLRLFAQCKTACLNLGSNDVSQVLSAAQQVEKVITFGMGQAADIYGYDNRVGSFGSTFRVRTELFDREFKLKMPGAFNIENALAAIAVAQSLNIPEEYIAQGLQKAFVKGRMEVLISKDQNKVVIVDYAHNELSFTKLYETVRKQYPDRTVVTVFGCPGEKAIIRRRDLGVISGLYSDKIVLTMEDPGEVDIRLICEEIAQYVKQNNNNYEIIEDRTEAIRHAIFLPEPDTVVLITGKGNERYQRIGRINVPYPSDVENAERFLAEYDTSLGKIKEAR
ncbi:MAG: UDP-N-acetylmuramyl-tripeptide synthetase [Peptococcia bacterium]